MPPKRERGNDNIAVMKAYWSAISALIGRKSRDFDKMKNGKVYNIYLHCCNRILRQVDLITKEPSSEMKVLIAKVDI